MLRLAFNRSSWRPEGGESGEEFRFLLSSYPLCMCIFPPTLIMALGGSSCVNTSMLFIRIMSRSQIKKFSVSLSPKYRDTPSLTNCCKYQPESFFPDFFTYSVYVFPPC